MKKIFAVVLLAILIIGCGPKMASKETLDVLAEARAALEAAESRIADLEDEIATLESMKSELAMEIQKLENDIEEVQSKIDTRCKKTGGVK
jgi:peptidoglycan hydrolase CwlO-like protein